ncbi:FUSC family protein [Streptomyces antimycoticus]|uniref:FUSC family protein n=1 Tax=Streptomyces antimycoticus TaxID=68175 RepID=UPI0032EEA5AE
MAAALATAFTGGRMLWPDHRAWVALTAFLVCSGARSRAAVLVKGVWRTIGASAGTAVAGVVAGSFGPRSDAVAVLIFAALPLPRTLSVRRRRRRHTGAPRVMAALRRCAAGRGTRGGPSRPPPLPRPRPPLIPRPRAASAPSGRAVASARSSPPTIPSRWGQRFRGGQGGHQPLMRCQTAWTAGASVAVRPLSMTW